MKLLVKIVSLCYIATLFYIFFLARRRPHATLLKHSGGVNLIPLKGKWDGLLNYNSLTFSLKWDFITNLIGNILIFIPIPFFLRFLFSIRDARFILFLAFVMSVCVELTQFILSVGVADVDDLILNTTGSLIGILFLIAIKKWLPVIYGVFDQISK